MSGIISGNMVGGAAPLKTVIFTDTDGNEFTGVVTGSEVVFTATDNDVREGVVYASDGGVSTGTKIIPAYHTTEGRKLIPIGSNFQIKIPHGLYDYTKLQALFCKFNTTLDDSVLTDRVTIDNVVYTVNSIDSISEVTIDTESESIMFNFVNSSDSPYIIRYFTYKEEY